MSALLDAEAQVLNVDLAPRSRCTCMAPLSDAQLKLMTLYGALQELEGRTVEAQHAVSCPEPIGNPNLREYLLKLQFEFTRAQGLCLSQAFPEGTL